jgi:pyrroline-5-carboxylate reductase
MVLIMRLGIIGCGKMGTALVQGAICSGVVSAQEVLGYDAIPAAADTFKNITSATIVSDMTNLISQCDTFILATKPQDISPVLKIFSNSIGNKPILLISIAAGTTIKSLESQLPENVRVIRCMPNTPALIGKGASAFAGGTRSHADDIVKTSALLSSVGIAIQVAEKHLDAVTGLSGSGPAYVFLMIEALSDAGVRNGLSRHDATQLAAQTLIGGASMVLETHQHPAVLKDQVTSPGGTTIAGLEALEKNGLRNALIKAVNAATKRSIQLSNL